MTSFANMILMEMELSTNRNSGAMCSVRKQQCAGLSGKTCHDCCSNILPSLAHFLKYYCASRRSLDRNKDGAITTNELQKALAGLGVPVDEQMAAQMVELIDLDHSSDISYEEFRRFAVLLPSSQVWLRHQSVGIQSVVPAFHNDSLNL